MEYPLSELIDRLSICGLRIKKLNEGHDEYNHILKEILSKNFKDFNFYLSSLFEVNSKIWELESDIRNCLDEKLGYEEIGRRAVLIRDLNKKRVSLKNEIVEKTGCGFTNKKSNHISQ